MPANVLIAVATCRRPECCERAAAQAATWARGQANVRFFVGDGPELEGAIRLAVDDSYAGLPAKVRGICRYALENNYDALLKLDDDVFLVMERLGRVLEFYQNFDYVGNFRARTGNYPHDYASGFCYYLGRRAMELVANAELSEDTFEDRWVGQVMGKSRMSSYDEKRFFCPYPMGIEESRTLWSSTVGKTAIAVAQYPARKMADLQYWYNRIYHP